MADKVQIKFRIGTRQTTAEKTARPEDVTAEVIDKLKRLIKAKGIDDLSAALFIGQDFIIKEIRTDAERFARNAASVMTRVRSPATGSVYVSIDDVNRNFVGAASFEEFREGHRFVEGGHTVVSWNALTARTLERKKRRNQRAGPRGAPDQFFVDSGRLRSLLITYLGPAFANLVDPKIAIRPSKHNDKITVTLTVLAKNLGFAKKGVSQANLPFLSTGSAGNHASASSENLMVAYLRAAGANDPKLAEKLTNPRGAQRPFLQPVLAFWLTNRLPLVLERALLKVMKSKAYVTRKTNRIA